MEEGQTGNEIVTALWREWASLQRLEWEMLKGFVFPSAGTQGEPSRTEPKQNYNSERTRSRAENQSGYYPSLLRDSEHITFKPLKIGKVNLEIQTNQKTACCYYFISN